MDKALELRNVSIVRDGNYILKSVDLDIYKGENVAVIGPNADTPYNRTAPEKPHSSNF